MVNFDGMSQKGATAYSKYIWTKILFIIICGILLAFSVLLALSIGSADIAFQDVFSQIIYQSGIVWNIRLPRVLVAILAGSMLAVAGSVMQCILKNPLSEPYTLGLKSSRCFWSCFCNSYSWVRYPFKFLQGGCND